MSDEQALRGRIEAERGMQVKRLNGSGVALLKQLLKVFADAFEDVATYQHSIPGDEYLRSLLDGSHFIAIVAVTGEQVIGGLAAYQLDKFEQDRREIYIYDLAVAATYRRRRVATSLIAELKRVANERRAYVIYVQADKDDEPAIRLYESLGTTEEVLHFDIPVDA